MKIPGTQIKTRVSPMEAHLYSWAPKSIDRLLYCSEQARTLLPREKEPVVSRASSKSKEANVFGLGA
jgi:D-hexose-6-phosphate mutarotase